MRWDGMGWDGMGSPFWKRREALSTRPVHRGAARQQQLSAALVAVEASDEERSVPTARWHVHRSAQKPSAALMAVEARDEERRSAHLARVKTPRPLRGRYAATAPPAATCSRAPRSQETAGKHALHRQPPREHAFHTREHAFHTRSMRFTGEHAFHTCRDVFAWAPFSSSSLTHSSWPFWHARCSALAPIRSACSRSSHVTVKFTFT